MLLESLNQSYMNMSISELMTNHPHIFMKFLFKRLRKVIDIKPEIVQNYYSNALDEFEKNQPENVFTYNEKEINIDNDRRFTFQLKGSNLFFTVGANRIAEFKVNSSINSKEFLNFFIEKTKIAFDRDENDYKSWRDEIYKDRDNEYSKINSLSDSMDRFSNIVKNQFKVYEIIAFGSKTEYRLSFKVSPEELPEWKWKVKFGIPDYFFMKFQANDLKKMKFLFSRYMKNTYNSELISIEEDRNSIAFYFNNPFNHYNPRKEKLDSFETTLKKMNQGETGTRSDYYRLIINNLFTKN